MEPAIVLGIAVLLLSIPVCVAIVVKRDAQRRGIDDPGRWAGIVLFTGGAGLIVYLLERDDPDRGNPDHTAFTLPSGDPPEESSSDKD